MFDVFSIIHVNENVCPFFPIIVSNQSSTSTAGDNTAISLTSFAVTEFLLKLDCQLFIQYIRKFLSKNLEFVK